MRRPSFVDRDWSSSIGTIFAYNDSAAEGRATQKGKKSLNNILGSPHSSTFLALGLKTADSGSALGYDKF